MSSNCFYLQAIHFYGTILERYEEMSKVKNRFSTLLSQKEIRDGRRYKQKEIADTVHVSPSTISRWLKGGNIEKSSIKTAKQLCDWLECDLSELLYLEPEAT